MRQFIRDLWYGEPVRVFAILAASGTAVVGFVDMPGWAKALVVALEGIAGAYGTRNLTHPEYVERVSEKRSRVAGG